MPKQAVIKFKTRLVRLDDGTKFMAINKYINGDMVDYNLLTFKKEKAKMIVENFKAIKKFAESKD